MSLPYLDGEQIREAEQAIRDGVPVDHIAAHFGCSSDELCQLLGRPVWKRIPDDNQTDTVDLWRADELGSVL
ncbi:MAG: hypothetical protein JNL58_31295 [Planctomyces sp.]|nr:hypothetical protein [Planctomyces sp.]